MSNTYTELVQSRKEQDSAVKQLNEIISQIEDKIKIKVAQVESSDQNIEVCCISKQPIM